jgi:multidrug resistance efflux pump
MNKPNLVTRILRALGLITLRNHETKCTRLVRFIRDRDAMVRWSNTERASLTRALRTVTQQLNDADVTIAYLKRELDNAERELFGMALRSPSNGGIQ